MHRFTASTLIFLLALQCPSTSFSSEGQETQKDVVIERGWKIFPIDLIAAILSLPDRLLLWNWKFKNRNVSDATLNELRNYMETYELYDVKVRVNKAAFIDEYRRLCTNKKMHWFVRFFPGFFVTTISLIFERLTAGDYYNPFNDTLHLFSDLTPVALHEAGHARDFDRHDSRGFYALMRAVPGMDLIQEDEATTSAINYLKIKRNQHQEIESYKILYPAFSTYIGGYFNYILPINLGSLGAVLFGHWIGRKKAKETKDRYFRASEHIKAQDHLIQRQQQDTHTSDSQS